MHRLLRSVFRLFLRAYPDVFRRRFGGEMESTFMEEWRERAGEGSWRRVIFLVRTGADLGVAGTKERMRKRGRTRETDSTLKRDDNTRRMTMGGWLEAVRQDLAFGARALIRRPGFTTVAVTTLALGIGANAAIFSVVNGVLLRPLPYPDSKDLVTVQVVWRGSDNTGSMSYPDLADVGAPDEGLESLVGYSVGRMTLTGDGEPRVTRVARLTEGLLATFRLVPALGRDIRHDEFGADAALVVVISNAFWRTHFAGDPEVLGKTVELDDQGYQVVGVAPVGFRFPEEAEFWVPRHINLESCGRGCHTWDTVGRLGPGATPATAQAALDRLAANLTRAYPDTNVDTGFRISRLQDHMVGDVVRGLWLLLGTVGVVLLIACANVANLLLVRASGRSGELSVRSALGAGRGRLRLQLLVESALLAVVGGGAGVGLAYGAVSLLRRVSPGTIPRIDQVGVDGSVLLFVGALVLGVTALFSLAPVLRTAAPIRDQRIRGQAVGADRSRAFLLATEVALSFVLLVGAGLLLRTLGQLYAVDLGFQTRQVVRFSLSLPEARYDELPEIRAFYRNLEERIRAVPGVEAVGSIFGAPLGRGGSSGDVYVKDRPEPPPGEVPSAFVRPVSPEYLQTVRVPLLRGRYLEASDDADGELVAVVSQRFADRIFPGENPIGRTVRVTVDMGYGSPWWRIVGVVGNVRSYSLTDLPSAEVYVPQGRYGPGSMTVTARTAPGVGSILPALREEVRALDPNLPLISPETMTEAVNRKVAPTRFYLLLIALFAGLAVVLAGVGLYGVVAYMVSRRTGEIGLRIALGADRGAIVRMVVRQGMRPAGLGIVVGVLVAYWGTWILGSLLYGVTPRDPWIFAGVSAFLTGLVLLASWLPARRATRIDPTDALRVE